MNPPAIAGPFRIVYVGPLWFIICIKNDSKEIIKFLNSLFDSLSAINKSIPAENMFPVLVNNNGLLLFKSLICNNKLFNNIELKVFAGGLFKVMRLYCFDLVNLNN